MLFILAIILFIVTFQKSDKLKKLDSITENENKKIEISNHQLKSTNENLNIQKSEKLNELTILNEKINTALQSQTRLSQLAFENYCDVLDKDYKRKEQEFDSLCHCLETNLTLTQEQMNEKVWEIQKDLDKISATRAAAIQAQIKEREIKEKLTFYCLGISAIELSDIKVLNSVKNNLAKPRILDMLIWSTYFQKYVLYWSVGRHVHALEKSCEVRVGNRYPSRKQTIQGNARVWYLGVLLGINRTMFKRRFRFKRKILY